MMQSNGRDEKVIDIAEARKRQKTLGNGAGGRGLFGKKQRSGASKDGKGAKKPTAKIWVYLQLLVFLGLVSYMMQLCKG